MKKSAIIADLSGQLEAALELLEELEPLHAYAEAVYPETLRSLKDELALGSEWLRSAEELPGWSLPFNVTDWDDVSPF